MRSPRLLQACNPALGGYTSIRVHSGKIDASDLATFMPATRWHQCQQTRRHLRQRTCQRPYRVTRHSQPNNIYTSKSGKCLAGNHQSSRLTTQQLWHSWLWKLYICKPAMFVRNSASTTSRPGTYSVSQVDNIFNKSRSSARLFESPEILGATVGDMGHGYPHGGDCGPSRGGPVSRYNY